MADMVAVAKSLKWVYQQEGHMMTLWHRVIAIIIQYKLRYVITLGRSCRFSEIPACFIRTTLAQCQLAGGALVQLSVFKLDCV